MYKQIKKLQNQVKLKYVKNIKQKYKQHIIMNQNLKQLIKLLINVQIVTVKQNNNVLMIILVKKLLDYIEIMMIQLLYIIQKTVVVKKKLWKIILK